MNNAKPCPFCGGSDLQLLTPKGTIHLRVVCMGCDTTGPLPYYSNDANTAPACRKLRELWNKRAGDQPPKKDHGELCEDLNNADKLFKDEGCTHFYRQMYPEPHDGRICTIHYFKDGREKGYFTPDINVCYVFGTYRLWPELPELAILYSPRIGL